MIASKAAKLRMMLTELYPEAEDIDVLAEEDGVQISIEIGGEIHRFSIDDDESGLLRYLITGSQAVPGSS